MQKIEVLGGTEMLNGIATASERIEEKQLICFGHLR